MISKISEQIFAVFNAFIGLIIRGGARVWRRMRFLWIVVSETILMPMDNWVTLSSELSSELWGDDLGHDNTQHWARNSLLDGGELPCFEETLDQEMVTRLDRLAATLGALEHPRHCVLITSTNRLDLTRDREFLDKLALDLHAAGYSHIVWQDDINRVVVKVVESTTSLQVCVQDCPAKHFHN